MNKIKILVAHSSEGESCKKATQEIQKLVADGNYDSALHSMINYNAIASDAGKECSGLYI